MLGFNQSQIKQIRRRLKREPDAKDAHLDLGVLYFKNKAPDKAMQHLAKAKELSAGDRSVKKMLAIVAYSNRSYEEAKSSFERLHKQYPADGEVCVFLSKIHLEEGNVLTAIEYLEKASETDSGNAEVWNDLGALSFSIQRPGRAERFFSTAIQVDNQYETAYMNLMDLYLQQGRVSDAEAICTRYQERCHNRSGGYRYSGMIARLQGRFYDAIHELHLAREKGDRDVEVLYELGLCFISISDYESAKDHFNDVLAIDPTHKGAKEKLVACYCRLEGANRAFGLLKEECTDISWKAVRKEAKKSRKSTVRLSVLVPAFNEADKILSNAKEIKRVLSGLGRDFEIVFVDDGSDDDTYDILELLSQNMKEVRPYRSRKNIGKGMALREAALKAKGELIVFLDADLELHPSLIGQMIKQMEEEDADVALGSKRHPESKVNYPWHRKVLSNLYYGVNRMLFGIPVKDTQTGIKVFKKEVLDQVIPKLIEKQYAFDLELIVNVHALGYRIIEVPIRLNYSRVFGRIGASAFIRTAIDTLAIFYRLKILKYYDRKQLPLLEFPRVSVVIAFKEYGPYARESLQHCLELDYPNFEIILLPDNNLDLKSSPRMKVIPTGSIPPSEKRDLGAKYATGEILAFLDDDAYPTVDWLNKAVRNFSDPEVAAVGGPALTPKSDNFRQKLSGAIFASRFVSGNFNYRYVPKAYQEVDDFPSCNLCVRKTDFDAVGGFDTMYWPGEDTILCLKIRTDLAKKIVYDPDAAVYHHRRELFGSHLRQVRNYALHRGFFVRKFPETSRNLAYFVPSLFVLFLCLGIGLVLLGSVWQTVFIPILSLYALMICCSYILSFSPKYIVLALLGTFATHVTYGLYFAKGLFSPRLAQ